jgi:hypothetical protein
MQFISSFTFVFHNMHMNINKSCYYIDTFGLFKDANMRVITIQREQYGATVHLFIGTRRIPGKSTFMSLTFTYDRNINH